MSLPLPNVSSFTTPKKKNPRKNKDNVTDATGSRRTPRKGTGTRSTSDSIYPGIRLYETTELLEQIVELFDWGSLTAIGISTVKLRIIRDRIIKRRIKFFLSIFVPEDDHERFFSLLKAMKCAVFGGIVRCIMCAGDPSFFQAYPHDMCIVTPFHVNGIFAGSWRRFLGSVNFTVLMDEVGDRNAVCSTRRIIHAKNNESGMIINVVESAKPSLLPAVMAFGNTSACNLLTADSLYCLYPKLIRRGENILINSTQTVRYGVLRKPFNFALRTFRSTAEWRFMGRPCGIQCAAFWRDSNNLTGSAIIPLADLLPDDNGLAEKQASITPISSSRVRWTIGTGVCQNNVCPFRGRGLRS